jgi:hypothetical protein
MYDSDFRSCSRAAYPTDDHYILFGAAVHGTPLDIRRALDDVSISATIAFAYVPE